MPVSHSIGYRVGAEPGAWLLLRSAVAPTIALPVPRQACLGLARAVLAGGSGDSGRDEPIAAWWRLAGDDPAVGVWLADQERAGVEPAGLLVARLAVSLVSGDLPGAADLQAWTEFVGRTRVGDDGMHGSGAEFARRLHRRIEAGEFTPQREWRPELAGERPVEVLLLREAVERMLVHDTLAQRFEQAVGEARLEAMRELAYGAGHEINNPLANIATRAQALLLEENDPERRKRLATIVDQAFRARDMIGGLMLFARPPKPQRAEAAVGSVIEAVITSIQAAVMARGVRLEYSPSPAPVVVDVDRGQIEEAVRAIALNAIEAVDDGGRVVVSATGAKDPGDGWCEIAVVDNGPGMDAATLRRACDPFFSGRDAGRGAGLGLSKASRFIESSGGTMVIESRSGEGTRVTVRLPLAVAVRQAR